jgi:AraC-like DNA-binding protein
MAESVKIHGKDWGLLPHRAALRDEFSSRALAPAFNGNPDFDWESVFAHCDGDDISDEQEVRALATKMTARATAKLLDWLLEVNLQDHRALKSIGVRVIAMAWVINPQKFDNASLAVIAKALGFKGPSSLSPSAAEFARQFGITNKLQEHNLLGRNTIGKSAKTK